jgi:CBS domain containing-hemolysin-like protein
MNLFVLTLSGPLESSIGLPPAWGLIVGLLLVGINGFFVAAEFALVKLRPTQIDDQTAKTLRGRIAREMVQNLDSYLSASQLGITLASLALGWVGEPAFAWIIEPIVGSVPGFSPAALHSISITCAFLVITTLHIVIGEQAPKIVAIRNPKPTSLLVAIPMYVFYKASYPAIWLLDRASTGLLRAFGVKPVPEHERAHDAKELRRLLASARGTVISSQKREMLDNVFAFAERSARQIMIPRADVVYLSLSQTLEENLRTARASGHTRFPLCRDELDSVIGLVHIKDLFQATVPPTNLDHVRREISLVPETLPLDRLLRKMRQGQVHMAAVLDEYGGVSGIVTLENVIEEIVGEIQDEFDAEEPELVKIGPATYVVSGSMLVADLEIALNLEFSERDEDTIAGIVLSELGRKPEVGDKVNLAGSDIEVSEVEGNRIKQLQVALLDSDSGSEPSSIP